MKRKRIPFQGLIILIYMLGLTACSMGESQPNLSSAMEAVSVLDYEGALNYLNEAELSGESEREILRGKGLVYLGLTEYDEAIVSFEECLKRSGFIVSDFDYDVNYYLATAYYKAGRPEDAEQVYSSILSLREDDADAYYLRGIVRLEEGKFEDARKDMDKVLALMPGNYDRRISVCEALNRCGYQDVAQGYLQAALDEGAKELSDFNKGRIYYYLNDFENARNFLEKAVSEKEAGAAYYLGKTWEALGEYNYAASVYSSYLSEQGENALIYNQLAICNLELKNYEAALEAVEKGISLDDSGMMQTLLFNRIVIYENMGEFKKANELMQNYLKNYPNDEEAGREGEFLKTR